MVIGITGILKVERYPLPLVLILVLPDERDAIIGKIHLRFITESHNYFKPIH